jgi:hypothetical protein
MMNLSELDCGKIPEKTVKESEGGRGSRREDFRKSEGAPTGNSMEIPNIIEIQLDLPL